MVKGMEYNHSSIYIHKPRNVLLDYGNARLSRVDKQIPLISHMFIKERSLNSGEGSIYPMFQVILHQYGSNMIFTAKHSGD